MAMTDYTTEATKLYLNDVECKDRRWATRVSPIDTEGRPLIDGHDYIKVDDGETVYIPDTVKAIQDYLTGFADRDRDELSDDEMDLLDDVQEVDPYAEVITWMN